MDDRYFAPGKLVLCGEYAVLAPGGEGLVASVDVGVVACARPAERWSVAGPVLGERPYRVRFGPDGAQIEDPLSDGERHRLRFVVAMLDAFAGSLEGRGRPGPLALTLAARGAPLGEGSTVAKLGLGSSAAATVALGAVLMAAEGEDPESESGRLRLFRLALQSHRRAQGGRGSGIDVAASVFGGVQWFRAGAEAPTVEGLEWVRGLRLLVGWTGVAVSTTPRVERVQEVARVRPLWFEREVSVSRRWTRHILSGLRKHDVPEVLRGMAMQRRWLLGLGAQVGIEMEHPALQALAEVGARYGAAKQSGAGGDCGILLLRNPEQWREAEVAMRQAGVRPLPVRLFVPGVGRLEVPEPSLEREIR